MKIFKTPKGLCKVCNEEKEQDIVLMGPNVATFMFYPCRHSVRYENAKPDEWRDENNNIVHL